MWWILQLDPPSLQLVCYSFLLRDLPIHSSDTKLVQNLIVGYNPDGKNGNL